MSLDLARISGISCQKQTNKRKKIDKLDYFRIKILCTKRQYQCEMVTHRTGENICNSCVIKDCYPEYIKNSHNPTTIKQLKTVHRT